MLGQHFFKLKHEQELQNFKNIKRPINKKCFIEPYHFSPSQIGETVPLKIFESEKF
jgi:hypothetical protein